MAYQIEIIKQSQKIFYYLLEHHELREEKAPELHKAYIEQDAKQHKWDCYSCLLHNSCFLRGLSSTRESKNFPYHVYKLNSGCKDSYFFRTCVSRSALLHVYN